MRDGNHAKVQAALNVRALDGDNLANVIKSLGVRIQTGMVSDGKGSGGYLFAPAHLQKQDFVGAYLLYDQPVRMCYVGQETIHGLQAYRYQAEYPQEGLTVARGVHTPGLNAGQRAVFHPDIWLWIEPTTGWLLKMTDNTKVDVVDKKTGNVIAPYNRFSAQYSDSSVGQQALYAASLKYQQRFAEYVAPGVVFVLLFSMPLVWLLVRFRSEGFFVCLTTAVVFVGSLIACVGWIFHYQPFITMCIGTGGVNPLAVIGFAIVLSSLTLLRRRASRRLIIGLGSLLMLLGVLVLAGRTNVIGFRLDEVLATGTIRSLAR